MELLGRIRRMHLRDGLGFSDIAKRTGLSRNTVKRWLKDAAPGKVGAPKYQRPKVPGKLAPYLAQIERWLVADAGRIKRDRRTGRHIFETIKQEGYVGGYSRLTDTIRQWRERQASATGNKQAFVPLAFAYGETVQFDWSEEGLVIGGIYYRMQVSHMKLCASRAFWMVAHPSQGMRKMFRTHGDASGWGPRTDASPVSTN